ncbi:MAG: TonB-dependent receptor [Prevotellaceae bacterium]|nr:TonB-dependent receptor [Prevotellaceae bacterium]
MVTDNIRITLLACVAGVCLAPLWAQEETDTLRQVVVTGTGTEHLLKYAPVQTEVISRKTIESYGGRSLEDILGGLTASFAFNEGDMGSQMQLNGLGNSYILVLIDGKRIHGDVGGENDLSLIDPQDIERIEIVKGAQSALYGSDAMAGVVNIITRKHQSEGLFLDNATRYGSYNDARQHNTVAWSLGKVTSTTNFQLQHTDGWRNTSQEYAEAQVLTDSKNMTVSKFTSWQLKERLTYTPMEKLELYAEGMYNHKSIMRPRNGTHPSCDVYTYDLMYRNANASAGGKWKINKTDALTLDVDWNKHAYFYEYTATTLTDGYDPNGNFTLYFPYFAGQRNLQSDQQRVIAQLKGTFSLPQKNLLTAGAEYRYDYLNAPMRTENGSASDWTSAVYAQDEFTLLPWLYLTGGLRLCVNENFGVRLTPKLSAMFPVGKFRIRAGWGQGFKTPTTKELYYRYLHVMGSSTYYNMGNTDLKAQTSDYLSASLEYRGERLTMSVTAYRNKLHNMIALVNVPVSEIPPNVTGEYGGDGSGEITARKYENMEDARTWGVDVNLTYTPVKNLTLGGNYTYLDTKVHQYNSTKDRLVEAVIDGMAHHKWNAYATWEHQFHRSYRLGLNLSTRGSSRRYYENDGDGKPFQLWRLNTTHDLGRRDKPLTYRLEAGVDNIFNYVDRTMHPYHLGTNSAGTTVYVSFRIQFRKGKRLTIINTKNNETDEED